MFNKSKARRRGIKVFDNFNPSSPQKLPITAARGSRSTYLSAPAIVKRKRKEDAIQAQRRLALSPGELAALEQQAADGAALFDNNYTDTMYNDVLNGHQAMEISHEGGEMAAMAENLLPSKKRRIDDRTRCDRDWNRQRSFQIQIEALTDAYMAFCYRRDHDKAPEDLQHQEDGDSGMNAIHHIRVIDIFESTELDVEYPLAALSPCAAIIAQGVIPTAPKTPTLGYSIKTLELYRLTHFRCPRLSHQAFVQSMADLQGELYQKYRTKQFSIAYDLYLEIRTHVKARVNKALNREDPCFHMRHVCPACMNKVANEPPMKFSMLSAMDGNDSLKRFERRAAMEEGGPTLGTLVESTDYRVAPSAMYISRARVDKHATKPGAKNRDSEEDTPGPCRERWKNMKPEATRCAFGCFGETGIFASFCRHGFNLTIADMYRTGEQSKYSLATAEALMDAHGADQGVGYDIACSHRITLGNSKLGPRARELNHMPLVDAFHGHAHNRECQVKNLTIYQDGLGLEGLGQCEQAFSKSNEHAGSTRTMGVYHRQQAISEHFQDTDNYQSFQSMTKYIHDMYNKALDIQRKMPAALERSRQILGLAPDDPFPGKEWLLQETDYLQNLSKEPPEETLLMEYCKRLQTLWDCEKLVAAIRSVGSQIMNPTSRLNYKTTKANEKRRRDAIELYESTLANIQNLEMRLSIHTRWTADSPNYVEALKMVAMADYQRALDTLEKLVVARLTELTSMNRARMGYKMRKHIGKALQTRSAAIKTALTHYNAAARALHPPREQLQLETILEYGFLSDFDLLRETRQDIRERPWATPTGRIAMEQYFKLCRAPEEILRCNIEIVRIVTHLRDEEAYLQHHEERIRADGNTHLAHQIAIHRNVRGRFNALHRQRLAVIAKLKGFSGSLEPGISLDTGPGGSASLPRSATSILSVTSLGPAVEEAHLSAEEAELQGEQEDDEEQAQEQEDEVDVLAVVMDRIIIENS